MVKIREKQTEQLEKAASKGLKLGGWKKMTLSSKIAAVVLVLVALTAILAPLLAPYSPVEIFTARQAPGNGFIFGTDDKGRDILSRMLYGGRYSLIIGFGATAMALVCGSVVGALAAVSRKAVSETIMRILDIIMSIPGIALAAVFVSILGNSVPSIIFAIGFMYTPQIARIVRANIVSEYGEDYVRAVIVSGAKAPWILIKHVLRNCIAPIMVFTVTLVADAIDTPEAVYQKDGITITVKQTIADDTSIYAIYEVTVPEDITIPETAEPAAGVLLPQLESSEESGHQNAGGGYHEILKKGPHHWTALVTSEGNSAPLADTPIRLVFLQFGYDTAEGSHVALEQEPIVLEWNLSKSTQAITVTPDQTVTVGNHTGKIETVSLSPISFTAFLSGTIPETPSLKLILRDGTECTPKNLAQDVKALYTDDGQRSSFFWRFEEIIDPSDVEKIVVGATEIVL